MNFTVDVDINKTYTVTFTKDSQLSLIEVTSRDRTDLVVGCF